MANLFSTFVIHVAGRIINLNDYLSPRNPTLLQELIRYCASFTLNSSQYGAILFVLGARAYKQNPTFDKMNFLTSSFIHEGHSTSLLESSNEVAINLPGAVRKAFESAFARSALEGRNTRTKAANPDRQTRSRLPPANLFDMPLKEAELALIDEPVRRHVLKYIGHNPLCWYANKIPAHLYSGDMAAVRETLRVMQRLGFNLPTAAFSA